MFLTLTYRGNQYFTKEMVKKMKITFLGTAAADQIPSPYCGCLRCCHARKYRGPDIRKRCSYLINNNLLIDMSPDLLTACSMHNVDLLNMEYVLITHGHRDHFDIANLVVRKNGFFYKENYLPKFVFVAPPSVMSLLNNSEIQDKEIGLQRKPVLPYNIVKLPPYHVKALPATHDFKIGDAVNYLIDDGESKTLIASDTAVYKDEVWPHLENLHLDKLVIECTVGTNVNYKEGQSRHLSIEGVDYMINKMKEIKAITKGTSIYATHFTHEHCPSHQEMRQLLKQIDVECAYDGLII